MEQYRSRFSESNENQLFQTLNRVEGILDNLKSSLSLGAKRKAIKMLNSFINDIEDMETE